MTREMTRRERLGAAIRREEPDRVPISPRVYDYLAGVEGCSCWMHFLRFAERMDIDPLLIVEPAWNNYLMRHSGPYDDLEGVKIEVEVTHEDDRTLVRRRFHTPAGELTDLRQIPSREGFLGFDQIIEYPVKGREDLDKLPFILPSPDTAFIGDVVMVKDVVGERGLVECRPTQGTDQMLMDAVGLERSMLLYFDDRDMLVELVRIFSGYNQAIMRRALEAGLDVIFDAWYNLSMSAGWSLDHWKEIVLPHVRRGAELTHEYGAAYHYFDDGKMDKTLEWLADADVDMVSTLTPPPLGDVDLRSAKARIGDRVCLKGNVEVVTVILQGRPEEVREAVREAIEAGAPGGGFILGSSDSIRPETPPENLSAYFDAAREFAREAYT